MVELLYVHSCMNTDSRALAWPRPSHNLTCVPRRPQHRPSSQASYESWNHPKAPRLPTSRYHIPASTPKIAAQTGNAQVASPENGTFKEAAASPGTPPTKSNHTWTLDPGPPPDLSPSLNERSVTSRAKCWLTAQVFHLPKLAKYPQSLVATVQFCLSFSRVNSELQPCPGSSSWTVKSELESSCHARHVTGHQQQQVKMQAKHQVRQVHEQTQTQTQPEKHTHEMTHQLNSERRQVELQIEEDSTA